MSESWREFYVMTGSSAAVLIGLLFVVVTLTADRNPAVTVRAARVYVTPTVFNFAAIVLVSAVALIPNASAGLMGVVMVAAGIGGLAYAISVALNLYGGHRPDVMHWSDPIFYALLPAIAHIVLVVAGGDFIRRGPNAANLAATAIIALLLIGVRDAWDVALWSAHHPEHDAAKVPPAAGARSP